MSVYFPVSLPLNWSSFVESSSLDRLKQTIQRIAIDCLAIVAALFLCLTVAAIPFAWCAIEAAKAGNAPILYWNRLTGKQEVEKVYGETTLRFLYGESIVSRIIGAPFLYLLVRFPIFSAAYGLYQKSSWSKRNIMPFINNFGINTAEFQDRPESFNSFNDFFIHKLKPEARPIASGEGTAVMPADGRYRFYRDIALDERFQVKGQELSLAKLLNDKMLAKEYEHGTMVLVRLCPTDYHRFHFPVDCQPKLSRLINGWLFSVNPIATAWAIKHNIEVFTENKRALTELDSSQFGKVLACEIGATTIGSINQTYTPDKAQKKGDEKGYFSFGASSMVLLFRKGALTLAPDLLRFPQGEEVECKMGELLGTHEHQEE